MRKIAFVALLLPAVALTACQSPDTINFGRKADGSPRAQLFLTPEARREARAAKAAALAQAEAQAGPGPEVGMPIQPGPNPEVLAGPVTVGLRREGIAVIAGKAVPDEEIEARLTYVRAERAKTASADVTTLTVLAPSQDPMMERIMHAMSCGYHAGFTKIGYQIVDSVPLPPPESFPSAALPADEGRLIVSVAPDGKLRLGTAAVETAALLQEGLQAAVAARQAKTQPPPAVTLLADKDAPLDAVQGVLAACRTAGITSVTLGSPVPVAARGAAPVLPPDVGEVFRNWRLSLESRDVDFSEGSAAYWYSALYQSWRDDSFALAEEMNSRVLNRERVKFFGANAAKRLDQMAHILTAVDADRGAALKSLGADVLRTASEAAAGAGSLDAARLHVESARTRVSKEFAPETVTIPPGTKIPPPASDPKKEEKTP